MSMLTFHSSYTLHSSLSADQSAVCDTWPLHTEEGLETGDLSCTVTYATTPPQTCINMTRYTFAGKADQGLAKGPVLR